MTQPDAAPPGVRLLREGRPRLAAGKEQRARAAFARGGGEQGRFDEARGGFGASSRPCLAPCLARGALKPRRGARAQGVPLPEGTLKLWLCQMLLALDYLQAHKVLHRWGRCACGGAAAVKAAARRGRGGRGSKGAPHAGGLGVGAAWPE
jgi:hypothetical protein